MAEVTAEEIIAQNEISDETLTFDVRGVTYTARVPADATSLMALEAEVGRWYDVMRKEAQYARWMPVTRDIVRLALYCERLIVSPRIALTTALRMAKTCRMLLPEIGFALMSAINGTATAREEEAIDHEGEDSREPSSEAGSEPGSNS